jgi:ribose transport system ATP-binding protein
LLALMLGEQRMSELERLEDRIGSATGPQHHQPATIVVRGLSATEVRDVNLEIEPGEIVGVAGLGGSGHLDIAYLLGGARRAEAGTITLAGRTYDARHLSPARMTNFGVSFVPPNRATEGYVARLDVADNLVLPQLRRFRRGPVISRRKVRAHAHQWIDAMDIRPANPAARVETLSGGNQQKVVLGKWLGLATTCLVLAEPTAGVDLGAKLHIYNLIRSAADRGVAVLVASTDITDLIAVCHRVVAMFDGRVVAELRGERVTERDVLASIAGVQTPATGGAS